MPANKIPRQLGSHRQAGIALYRALLTQCRSAPLELQRRDSLANIIRNRFRTPRPQRLRLALAFQSGYAALDLLDASVTGDSASTQRIQDLISKTPQRLHLAPKPKAESTRVKNLSHKEPPRKHKFLAVFPRPNVEGIRRVPVLVDANGLPFIRYKKPQPENVSRMLRQKLEQRQKLWNHLHNLESYFLPLAEYEDNWDAILEKNTGNTLKGVKDGATFHDEMKAAKRNTQDLMRKEVAKLTLRVQVMTNIILKEKELAVKERDERRRSSREKREAHNVEDASQAP